MSVNMPVSAALITYAKCSLSRIFRERDMDYYHFEEGSIAAVNARAAELILRDEHDFILIYNGTIAIFEYTNKTWKLHSWINIL